MDGLKTESTYMSLLTSIDFQVSAISAAHEVGDNISNGQ